MRITISCDNETVLYKLSKARALSRLRGLLTEITIFIMLL
ncbi:Hypothetical protein ETEE_0496 [Edwardsiella anguillarum ET080813]|uniref:Uncharacterized protein n=1 Tax=Edwardsiella anguillarum ET080813 TaxID=667120 RepID=A0A076LMN6_9GAMM|nr:Hypothetical protein ETEE_0496 [Edwardsiella anguillarum ET080813]